MPLSYHLEQRLLNHAFRNTPYTPPGTIYLALFTSNPTKNNTGTEVSGGGYARRPIAFAAAAIENNKMTIKNPAEIPFAVATGTQGLVSHFGIFDALTGGNLMSYDSLDPRSIVQNDKFIGEQNRFIVRFP
ncbi:phage tail fiber protein [Paenibacillus daejeonensis]|uniref:phage tail fiber protein n=1 Tax=Paenibacillus daejeonensis TaxID=135193 RepID=UPI00037AD2DB|nr:hypothetical protein [Paenibacillus daejeonensis]